MSIVDCKERGLVVQLGNNTVGILQCEEMMTELNAVSHYKYMYMCIFSTTEVSNVRLTWNRKLTYIFTRTRIIAGYIGHKEVLERPTPTTPANAPTMVTQKVNCPTYTTPTTTVNALQYSHVVAVHVLA